MAKNGRKITQRRTSLDLSAESRHNESIAIPNDHNISFSYVRKYGEPDRIRTCDPLIKSQLLYQLSYGPAMREPSKGICGGLQGLFLKKYILSQLPHWQGPLLRRI